jgi:hypothetical protein
MMRVPELFLHPIIDLNAVHSRGAVVVENHPSKSIHATGADRSRIQKLRVPVCVHCDGTGAVETHDRAAGAGLCLQRGNQAVLTREGACR